MKGLHGIIFSYEKRNNLRELSEVRCASSIPFGGRYRAVDFALSSLVNAGVTDVGIVLHGNYQSLLDHLGTGKDWDLSRKRGGLKILPPFAYKREWGEEAFRGKMEALAGVRSYLDTIRQDYVVLMEGDLVANLPLAEIYENHIATGADITVVCGNDSFATENGTYFNINQDGRITEVFFNLHRPQDPAIREDLFCRTRPVLAKGADKSSSYIGPNGHCVNSLVADGCKIEGSVENSILFPGVTVEAGAKVCNCVLFKDAAVRSGAQLAYIIADKRVEILPDRTLMGHSSYPIVLAKGSQV